jgi:UDPglucose 6-dehydrogenase
MFIYEACKGAHAIAIITEWEEFKSIDYTRIYEAMERPAFFVRGKKYRVDHAKFREIGFEVYGIGKPDVQ